MLYGDCWKGRRLNFMGVVRSDYVVMFYNYFNKILLEKNVWVEIGVFGEMMDVLFINDGLVMFIVESKEKM